MENRLTCRRITQNFLIHATSNQSKIESAILSCNIILVGKTLAILELFRQERVGVRVSGSANSDTDSSLLVSYFLSSLWKQFLCSNGIYSTKLYLTKTTPTLSSRHSNL